MPIQQSVPDNSTINTCNQYMQSISIINTVTCIYHAGLQMDRLREMKDIHGNPIAQDGNCRPRQPHGARIVEANFAAKTGRKKPAYTTSSLSGKNSDSLAEKEGH